MRPSRAVLISSLLLLSGVELAVFVSMVKPPPESAGRVLAASAVPAGDSLAPGEALELRSAPRAPAAAPAPPPVSADYYVVLAQARVSSAGDIDARLDPGEPRTACPTFAPGEIQWRTHATLAETAAPLQVRRTVCVTTAHGRPPVAVALDEAARLSGTDEGFEGTVVTRALRFTTPDGQVRELRVAGLFWCPSEEAAQDVCYAGSALETNEAASRLLVPMGAPGTIVVGPARAPG